MVHALATIHDGIARRIVVATAILALALAGSQAAARETPRQQSAVAIHDAFRVDPAGSSVPIDRTTVFRQRVPSECRERVPVLHAADSARPATRPQHAWTVRTDALGRPVTVFIEVFTDPGLLPPELAAHADVLVPWLSLPFDDDRSRPGEEIPWIVCALALRDALATSDWRGAAGLLDALDSSSGAILDGVDTLRTDLVDLQTTPLCREVVCNENLAIAVIAALQAQGVPLPRDVEPRPRDITSWHMRRLTRLTLDDPEARAQDLSGLESAANLVLLIAREQGITDLTPIGHLARLEELDVRHNGITSLAPLHGALGLRVLLLDGNPLTGGAEQGACAPDPLRPLYALRVVRLSVRDVPGGLPCPLQGALAAHVEVLDISNNGDAFAAVTDPIELPSLMRLTADDAPPATVDRIVAPALRELQFRRSPRSLEPRMGWYLPGEVPDLRRFPTLTSIDLAHRHIAWVQRPFDGASSLRSVRLHGTTSHLTLSNLHYAGVDPTTLLPTGVELVDLSVPAVPQPCRMDTTPVHGGGLPLSMIPAAVRALDASGRCLLGLEHASLDLDLLCVIGSDFGPPPRAATGASTLRVRHLVFGSDTEFGPGWARWLGDVLERPGADFRASHGDVCPLPTAVGAQR